MKSLKFKWLVPYIFLLLSFTILSIVFGFYMAKQSLYDSLSNTEQQRLEVKISNFYEQFNNSSIKFSTLTNNKIIKTPIKKEMITETGSIKYTETVINQMKPFMFSNKEFEAVFLITDSMVIGASKNDRYFSKRKKIESSVLNEESIRNILGIVPMTMTMLHEENMLISRLSEDMYLIAVLDFSDYFQDSDIDLELLDLNKQILFSKSDQNEVFELKDEVFGQYEYSSPRDYVLNGYLYSYIKDYKNIIFVTKYSTDKIDTELRNMILIITLFSFFMLALFIFFAIKYITYLMKPLDKFVMLLNSNVKQKDRFKEEAEDILNFFRKSVKVQLRIFYLSVLIPIICINLFLVFALKENVRENIIYSQEQMTKEWIKHIDSEIRSYQDSLQFLSIDNDIQNIITESKPYDSNEINYTLISKGAVQNDFVYTEIESLDGQLIFSNQPLLLKSNEKNLKTTKGKLKNNDSINYFLEIGDHSSILSLEKVVLSIDNNYRAQIFDEIGYIVVSFDGFIENNFFIADSFPIDVLEIIDKQSNLIYSLNSQSEEMPIFFSDQIESLGLEVKYGFLISMTEFESRMLYFYLLMFLLLCFLLFLVEEITSHRLIIPLKSLVKQMDEINNYDVHNLVIDDGTNEFYLMANSFNSMMLRLQELTNDLMYQEQQNNELEKRHMRLLLTSIEAQVSPHFLHNIITSIIFLVKADKKDTAIHMLLETSEFFKRSLYGTKSVVTLREEILHVENYIEIQKIRVPDKISITYDIPKNFYEYLVPKFMLQPLIENSIEHGMKALESLQILIRAYEYNQNFYISIEDNGIGISRENKIRVLERMEDINDTENHGLSNIHQRIHLVCGEGYGVEIKENDNGAKIILKLSVRSYENV